MSSGHRRVVFNLRERTVSPDHQRAQTFAASEQAEILRFLLQLESPNGFEAGGHPQVADIPSTVGTPLRGDVLRGLTVTPVVGTTSVHVMPGVAGLEDPDGQAGSSEADPPNPDDSPYKVVVDRVGVTTNGVLTIAANAGPGDRLDVVECRRNPGIVTEQDTRDVFATSGGVFAPTLVDKVEVDRLEFRVRAGAAGGGLPALAQGWLPLCVAHVAPGAGATTDDVDFWDVRPLVEDRVRQPVRASYGHGPAHGMQQLYGDVVTGGAGQTRVSGHFWGQIGGVLAGGAISRGSPGADQAYVDAQAAEFQEPGFAPAALQILYFWLLFPFGLPRWVRYNRTPSGGLRFPSGMRGIPLYSTTAPAGQAHEGPAAPLAVPAYLDGGAGVTTTDAVLAAAHTADLAGAAGSFVAGGEWVEILEGIATPSISPPLNGTGNAFDNYQLVAGTHFPRDARKVRVIFGATFTGVAGTNLTYNVVAGSDHLATGRVTDAFNYRGADQFDVGASILKRAAVDIERIPEASGLGADLFVQVDWNAAGFVGKSAEFARVLGWKQTG